MGYGNKSMAYLNLLDHSYLTAAWCRNTGLCTEKWMKASNTLVNPDLHIPKLPTLAKAAGMPVNIKYPTETPSELANEQYYDDIATRHGIVSAFADKPEPDDSLWTWPVMALAGVVVVLLLRK